MSMVDRRPAGRAASRSGWLSVRAVGWFRGVSLVAFTLAAACAAAGFLLDDSTALAIAGFAVSLGFLSADLSNSPRRDISPATLMAAASLLIGFGHIVAMTKANATDRGSYFIYAIDEYIPLALKIAFVASILPILGFRWVVKSEVVGPLIRLLPVVEGRIGQRLFIPGLVGAAALGMAAKITGALSYLGTLAAVAQTLPILAAFVLARVGAVRNWRAAMYAGLIVAIAEATRAIFFAYLRSDMIAPIFAYSAGLVLGARSLRPLKRPEFVPVYVAAVLFVIYFAAFAEVRGRSSTGLERLGSVQAYQEHLALDPSRQNVMSRLTTFNQITQLLRVVHEDGFLHGESLEYLGIAFIPRFLWPEKPEIAKGAWFALRIGQARIHNGRITNAVNMTVGGEFYLNFGWSGVIFGTFFFGAIVGVFWSRTRFWQDPYNVLGAGFGYYLLWTGFVGAADLQTLVTLVALYMIFVAFSFVAQNIGSSGRSTLRNSGDATTGTPPSHVRKLAKG